MQRYFVLRGERWVNSQNRKLYVALWIIMSTIFIMNCAVYPFSRILFLISLSITLVMGSIIFAILKSYQNHIFIASRDITKLVNESGERIFDNIPVPAMIIDKESKNEIFFYNNAFKKELLCDSNSFAQTADEFISGEKIEKALSKQRVDIELKNKKFSVTAHLVQDFIVICFFDTTEYKNLMQKYIDDRLCIGYVLFDNKEELSGTVEDEQYTQISATVDNILMRWMSGAHGICKKLGGGRYLLVFEEKYLKSFIADKFSVIDKVHTAKIDNSRYATISAGISRGAESAEQAHKFAEAALNMSLGRGGDQVAVNHGGRYEFFGGASRGFEKHSKVRTRVAAMTLLDKINCAGRIFIMGHQFSDFDSIGAAAGLWSVCSQSKRKETYIVVNKERSLAKTAISYLEKCGYENVFLEPEQAASMINENSLLIIVDTHCVNFVESRELYKKSTNTAVIDHHRLSVDKVSDVDMFFHEPFASSTCEIVTELIQYMGDKHLKKPECECLLAGIMLDTKNFSLKSGVRTFEAAAYLRRKGADSISVKKMFACSMELSKAKCRIIQSAEIIDDCAVAMFEGSGENTKIACAQAADELLSIKNIKASFVLSKIGSSINISARSTGDVNVQLIMEKLGGGGHQTMAAAQIKSADMLQAKENLIEIIKQFLEKSKT